ncbi:MAG: apolipoprotein N-acyltransferase [bacterium]
MRLKIFRSYLTIEEKKLRRKELMLGVISGILIGISFPPFPLQYLAFIAFIPFLFALERREGLGGINRLMFSTIFIFNLIALYWVGSWMPEADTFLMISGVLLMFVNPTIFMIASTLYFTSKRVFNKKIALFLLPVFWVAFEYFHSITDLKFPWLTLGNSQPYFTPYIQIADIIGAHGLTLLILYVNIFFYLSVKNYLEKKKFSIVFASLGILFLLVPLIYGFVKISNFEKSSYKLKVGLIQPNLNPWKKWAGGNLNEQLSNYLSLSDSAVSDGAKLIIWPESALPVYLLSGTYPADSQRIKDFVREKNVFLLTGMPDATFSFDKTKAPEDAKPLSHSDAVYISYNSLLFFSPLTHEVKKYGKIKLVPFGEKVPFVEVIPFLGDLIKWNVGISSWNTGKDTVVFSMPKNLLGNNLKDSIKIGGVICIESIYPDYVAAFVQRGANFISVVTNDSWYGNSSGPYQHKEISTLRAVENRRAVVRAANGGITCLIDPLGRTISESVMYTRTYLVADVPIEKELTFYTRNPLIVPILCAAAAVWIFGLFLLKKYKEKFLDKDRESDEKNN